VKIVEKQRLYNPFGDDALENRRMLGGNSTGLINLNSVRYSWAPLMYRIMMANFWIPEKVDLSQDVVKYAQLTDAERRAYNGIVSFLVFLDSLQTNNLPNIGDYITAPEVSMLVRIQGFQEVVHAQSYAYLIESVIPKMEKVAVYEFWRDNEMLYKRNEYIASIYQSFVDNPNDPKALWKVLVANYLLEGLYFYNGFTFFYNLASRDLCIATADMIRYINRDEYSHCILFENIMNEIKNENPEIYDEQVIYDMMREAVDQEIAWTNHIVGSAVLGITPNSTEAYTKYLANKRLSALGLAPLYPDFKENPYNHLEQMADEDGAAKIKANFFESTVTSYSQSSAIKGGWDEDGWDS
jgi:ribonucleoside-diphosphate reductase beta chain